MTDEPKVPLDQAVAQDGRYPLEAFAFLRDGLERAVKSVHGEAAEAGGARHVTGPQLCQALRDEALERWGLLALHVLNRWNVHSTIDFGNMVYLLVHSGHMRKTEEDSLEDFRDVYDFAEAFGPRHVFGAQN